MIAFNDNNLMFFSNNVKGIQKSEKRIKIFETHFRKHIALLMTKKGGATILMVVYIFLTEKLIWAV